MPILFLTDYNPCMIFFFYSAWVTWFSTTFCNSIFSWLQSPFLLLFSLTFPGFVLNARTTSDDLYLGVGYNLIRGNPDGGEWAKLGQDPGLQLTRNVLETSVDGSSYVKRTAYPQCTHMASTALFYDPDSYQDYLLHYISITGIMKLTLRHFGNHTSSV